MKSEKPTTEGERRLFSRIQEACEKLNYVSETDSPVQAVFFRRAGEISVPNLRKAADVDAESEIERTKFDEFFAPLTTPRNWHTREQRKNAEGFAHLGGLLKKELSDLAVFRIGRVRIWVYAIGLDAEGNWLGVRMEAVET